MRIIETMEELRTTCANLAGSVGLIASTSGIHQGQLSLIERARKENTSVIVCLFPDQLSSFTPDQPAWDQLLLGRDLTKLKHAGAHFVFVPPPEEIYPLGFATTIYVEITNDDLEQGQPPGQLVTYVTLMCRLINLARPKRVYLGQRHALQAVSIRRMVTDLCLPTQVVICPTVREADGLPISNSNSRLTSPERMNATILVRALRAAQARYAQGVRNGGELREAIEVVVASEPSVNLVSISVADPESLVELARVEDSALASLAILVSDIRLSDNVLLGTPT